MWKSRVVEGLFKGLESNVEFSRDGRMQRPKTAMWKSRVVELVLNEFYLHLLRDMLSKEWLENTYRNNEPTANFYFRHK